MNIGQVIALIGLALCVILCGGGSSIALWRTGCASAGVLAEDGKKFSKVLVLAVLPATQGIYGFVLAIIASGGIANITTAIEGWNMFFAVLPLTIVGFASAIFQGLTSVAGIMAISKNESISGKLILFPAMVETYAILALVISIMLI